MCTRYIELGFHNVDPKHASAFAEFSPLLFALDGSRRLRLAKSKTTLAKRKPTLIYADVELRGKGTHDIAANIVERPSRGYPQFFRQNHDA